MKTQTKGGFMQIVILAIIIIASLAYFNVDLQGLAQNDLFQKVMGIVSKAVTDYILPLVNFLKVSTIQLLTASSETASSTAPTVIAQ